MLVKMIGREGCTRCEEIHPQIEEYCNLHDIEFCYGDQSELSKDDIDMLVRQKITLLPIFMIYNEDQIIYSSSDNIYDILERSL